MANAASEETQRREEKLDADQWKTMMARHGWCEKETVEEGSRQLGKEHPSPPSPPSLPLPALSLLSPQHTHTHHHHQFCVKSVEIPRCSSWTRLCSCAQPVETPQAQFFSFWDPVHRYRAGGPCHEDRGRVAQTPGSSLPRCLASHN